MLVVNDDCIIVVMYEVMLGVGVVCNIGIVVVMGWFVVFLDVDDEWYVIKLV